MRHPFDNRFRTRNISEAIQEMRETGATIVRGMLLDHFREAMLREIAALPFKQAAKNVGKVEQNFDYCSFFGSVPAGRNLETLRRSVEVLVWNGGFLNWRGREVAINRYVAGGGLTAHRDFKWHPDVLAIWNVCGTCTFEVLETREGPVVQTYYPQPGDLILLRGAGPADDPVDRRPFHCVRNIESSGPRISVTIRHNTDPDRRIEKFAYANA